MTKDAIKKMALKLFAEKGFESTSIRDIAYGVGIKAPSIYSHFLSKEEIYMELSEQALKDYGSLFKLPDDNCASVKLFDINSVLFHIFQNTIYCFLSDRNKGMLWIRALIFPPSTLKIHGEEAMDIWNASFEKNCRHIFSRGIALSQIKNMDLQVLIDSYRSLILGNMISLLSSSTDCKEPSLDTAWQIYWSGIAS